MASGAKMVEALAWGSPKNNATMPNTARRRPFRLIAFSLLTKFQQFFAIENDEDAGTISSGEAGAGRDSGRPDVTNVTPVAKQAIAWNLAQVNKHRMGNTWTELGVPPRTLVRSAQSAALLPRESSSVAATLCARGQRLAGVAVPVAPGRVHDDLRRQAAPRLDSGRTFAGDDPAGVIAAAVGTAEAQAHQRHVAAPRRHEADSACAWCWQPPLHQTSSVT
jgi:hypothetical protein